MSKTRNNRQPPKLGDINPADKACLQIIVQRNGRPVWATVGQCLDTPNSIIVALRSLRQDGIDTKNVWINTPSGRRPLF